ncbi:MAG: hypothetical protein EHM28_01010 [Spirochaetaceae bacterium]|nr:MAG: hypothetical protein EHM28_01010 [Spirochaetaceae bacterium]
MKEKHSIQAFIPKDEGNFIKNVISTNDSEILIIPRKTTDQIFTEYPELNSCNESTSINSSNLKSAIFIISSLLIKKKKK